MLIVGNFLSFVMVIFNGGVETNPVEGEIRLGIILDSWLESFPCWLKTSDGSSVEKHRSYHPTGKLKYDG